MAVGNPAGWQKMGDKRVLAAEGARGEKIQETGFRMDSGSRAQAGLILRSRCWKPGARNGRVSLSYRVGEHAHVMDDLGLLQRGRCMGPTT